uniref:Uncharacterized protein n=1 Tax=Arundo donax TaxID=35708 RepID=A0A0A9H152_ARUDO
MPSYICCPSVDFSNFVHVFMHQIQKKVSDPRCHLFHCLLTLLSILLMQWREV